MNDAVMECLRVFRCKGYVCGGEELCHSHSYDSILSRGWVGRERETLNSNWKTLFYKDCV